MARSDLLITLVRSGMSGDLSLFKKTVEAIIAEERAKNHNILAERLADNLRTISKNNGLPSMLDEKMQNLLLEVNPTRSLDDLILPMTVRNACSELIEEQHRADLLRSYNLEPRHRILLAGPPGNGKTTLAEALANSLMVPLLTVRYEGIIGSYLGETAVRLKRLIDYVRTRNCVLFFDEFDAIGKERGDVHETGEIKRVVSSLLLQIDSLPNYVVVIAATNHPELLDSAAWRRFQVRLLLPKPNMQEIEEWLIQFERRFGHSLNHSLMDIASRLKGLSFAEIEDFTTDIYRRYVLSLPQSNIKEIVDERIKQWAARFSISDGEGEQV